MDWLVLFDLHIVMAKASVVITTRKPKPVFFISFFIYPNIMARAGTNVRLWSKHWTEIESLGLFSVKTMYINNIWLNCYLVNIMRRYESYLTSLWLIYKSIIVTWETTLETNCSYRFYAFILTHEYVELQVFFLVVILVVTVIYILISHLD